MESNVPPGTTTGWRLVFLCAAAWALVEAALLAFRPGYPFTMVGFLDTWFYTSFQWDLPRQMEEFGNTYYSARMSLFLPGTMLHALLPPALATIAYKLLISAGTTWAWAYLSHREAGPRAAVLAAAVGPVLPWFIIARHNDYMDLGILFYGSLSAACIVAADGAPRARAWRVALGFCFGSMLIANLSVAASLGLGLVVCYFVQHPERWRQRVFSGLEIAAGVALSLALFGAASRLAGGPAWVMGSQIAALLQIGGLEKNPWAPTDWSWLQIATWLLVPVAALVSGLVSLLDAEVRRGPAHRVLRALLAGHAVALAGALALEVKGMGVLYHWFYGLFHFVLGVPLLIVSLSTASRDRAASSAIGWGAFLAFLIIGGSVALRLAGVQTFLGLKAPTGALSVALGLIVLLIGVCLPRRFILARESVVAALVVCSVPIFFNSADERLRDRYLLVHETFHKLNDLFPTNRYRLWIDGEFFDDGRAVVSSKLYGLRLLTEKLFPEVERQRTTDLPLIVPTKPGAAAARFAAAQAAHPDAEFSAPTVHEIRQPSGLGLDLLVFTMRKRTLDPEAANAPGGPYHLLLDWKTENGRTYGDRLAAMIYKPTGDPAVRDEGDHPSFQRTTAEDHLATPFVPLPPGKGREAFVVLELPAAADGIFVLQADQYRNLGLFTLGQPGRLIQRFTVDDDSKSVRIYFQSLTDARIPLPRRVALYITVAP